MMARTRLAVLLLASGLVVLAAPERAEACERTMTCSVDGPIFCFEDEIPQPIAWPSRCVGYHINDRGSDEFASFATLRAIIDDAFATWDEVAASHLELIPLGLTNVHQAGYILENGDPGNLNVAMFVEDNWPSSYPDTALALTSVTYDINGVIYDADIEMNGARFRFSDVEPGSLTSFYDVRSTLVHEVGHFVGLDHTRAETFVGSGDPEEATMHASSRPGETQKRVLTNDDIACFAEAYPFDVDTTSLLCAPNPDADFYRYVEAAEATGEGEHGELCVDGVDNDGDGLVDCDEPDCAIVLDCCTVEPCKTGTIGGSGGGGSGGGCATVSGGASWMGLALIALMARRRRRL